MIDYGIRSGGGGIGDVLPKISYNQNTSMYYGKFVYSTLFYIIVVSIVANMFLGIIVDTFADLRDKNDSNENDKKNICYICQITRNQCIRRKIDFEEHKKTHYLRNYVYFISYLYMDKFKDLNPYEKYAWQMLENEDISWIPVQKFDSDI